MSQGKFSKPRDHFEPPLEQTPSWGQPLEEWEPESPSGEPEEPETSVPPLLPEEEAMDHAFAEVAGVNREEAGEDEGFFDRNKRVIFVSACAAALVLLLGIIGFVAISAAADPYDGKILGNVLIGDIPVGGMTRSQAEAAVRSATADTFTKQDMVVTLADTTLRFSPEETHAKLDVSAVVNAAYQYGRKGTKEEQQAAYQASLTGNHTIAMLPYLNLDEALLRSKLQEFAASVGSVYVPTDYTLEGERPCLQEDQLDRSAPGQTLKITLGTPGLGVDVDGLYNDILDAYSFNRFHVERKNLTSSMTPEAPDLEAIYEACCVSPVNASLNFQTYEPIPGSYGYGFDMAQAQKLVAQAGYGDTVTLPLNYIEPEVTVNNLLYQDELGHCETPHGANENRNINLRLVCEILDGVVIKPGEEFSYNEAVGERTTARGFRPAPAYSGTKLVDAVGGGVCQGSSTLYNCALTADMEITERVNHGFPSSYIGIGLDATVSWGGPDLKFRNTGSYPVQIRAEVSGGYMRMKLMGTETRDYYVIMESETTAVIKQETVHVKYGPDSGYRDGQVLEAGCPGYNARSYKCKYSIATDELISREFEVMSSYMSTDRVVVKIVEEKPATPPEESGSEEGGSTEQTPGTGGGTGGDSGTGEDTGTGGSGGDSGTSGGGSTGGDSGSGGESGTSGGGTGGESGSSGGGSTGGDSGTGGGGSTGGDSGTGGDNGSGGGSSSGGGSGTGGESGSEEDPA